MGRVVDYFKKLFKKKRITNSLIRAALKNEKISGDYDLNNKKFCKVLSEIEELSINCWDSAKINNNFPEELKLILQEMKSLKVMKLSSIQRSNIDISAIFENINNHIENITIEGFDISSGISKEISKEFKELKKFRVSNSNMPNIPIFDNKECELFLYEGLDKITTFDYINYGLNVKKENFYCHDSVAKQIIFEKNCGYQNEFLPLDLYEKCPDAISFFDNKSIAVNDISELDSEKIQMLKKDKRIENIIIKTNMVKYDCYSFDEFDAIREEMDKIVAMVELPQEDDPDREKKIFAQVYKLLGERISYDYYAISEEGEKDDELQKTCRNLKNGLLGVERDGEKQYLAVCAGYADILRNVLSCCGVDAKYIGSAPVDYNGPGHAYNLVKLDGQKYYCDLTWDSNNIKAGRYPLENFLVSHEEFLKTHQFRGLLDDMADKDANVTVSYEEQCALFGQIMKPQEKVEEMIHENYLSGFVSEYLSAFKQVKEKLEIKDFFGIMSDIKSLEDDILSPSAKDNNITFDLKDYEYVFKTSDEGELKKLKEQIVKRRRREVEHESR